MIPGATAPHVAVHFCATKQSTTMAATSVAHAAPRAAVRASVPQPGRCHAAMRERQPCAVPESPCNQLTVYCCLFAVLRWVVIVLRSSGDSGRLLCGWFARRHSSCPSVSLFAWRLGLLRGHTTSLVVRGALGTGQPQQGSRVLFLAESQDWSLLASMMLICPGRRVTNPTFELPLTSGPFGISWLPPRSTRLFCEVFSNEILSLQPCLSCCYNRTPHQRVSHIRSKSIKRCPSVKTPSKCVLFHMQIDTLCACSLVYRPLIT